MATGLTAKDAKSSYVLLGVLTLIFGFVTVFWPGLTILTLVYLVGAYLLVSGVVHIVHGISRVSVPESWWYLTALLGVVEVGFGIYILRHPALTFTNFVVLLGFALIIRGVVEFVGALFGNYKEGSSRALALLSGLLALVVGIVILDQRAAAGVAFVWVLGAYAIVVGCMMLAAASNEG